MPVKSEYESRETAVDARSRNLFTAITNQTTVQPQRRSSVQRVLQAAARLPMEHYHEIDLMLGTIDGKGKQWNK
jgi:hypothetical protein